MGDDFTWSYQGARSILLDRGLMDEIRRLPEVWERYGGNDQYSDRSQLLDEVGGWKQGKRIRFSDGVPAVDTPRDAVFDAYKSGIAIEHESGEAMRAIWHMMKFDIAFRDVSVFSDPEESSLDVGVLLVPESARNPSGKRARRDILSILSKYFDVQVPIFIWEYSR